METTTPMTENDHTPAVCWYTLWHMLMLDNPFRRFLQNPEKILAGHIRPGMTAIDIGCGPGDFTKVMAGMAEKDGQVIAIDLQDEMLSHAQRKCQRPGSGAPITWHRCRADTLGITASADFALSFYMVHEVPDQDRFLREVFSLLRPGGRYLIVEPVFHVTDQGFEKTLQSACRAGFAIAGRPAFSLSRAVLLERPAGGQDSSPE